MFLFKLLNPQMHLNKGQQAAYKGICDLLFANEGSFAHSRQGKTVLLQGAAGTGKTAVVGSILQEYIQRIDGATNPNFNQWGKRLPGKLCVAAMSHKAKGELGLALSNYGIFNHPLITCDQLLKARPAVDHNTRKRVTMRQQVNLDSAYTDIFIDEVSMLSQQYFDWLMEWKMPWQNIIFIGDKAQLPPVSDGALCSVFKDCDITYDLTEVMRHDGAILNACTKIRRYGVGYPKLETQFDDADKGVIVMDNKKQFLEQLYKRAEEDPSIKVVCHTNANVMTVNDTIHKIHNPTARTPFVPGQRIMTARAYQCPISGDIIPSSMDLEVKLCGDMQIDLGLESCLHIPNLLAVWQLMGNDGASDKYQCHWVTVYYDGAESIDKMVKFRVFNHHRGEEKRFKATQEYLKAWADDTTHDQSLRVAMNKFIYFREQHFAEVHLSTAMTIHKSQGSSFKEVWVYPDVPNQNNKTSNQLAYVAASRAQQRLVVCN